jgi:hypothetical protein
MTPLILYPSEELKSNLKEKNVLALAFFNDENAGPFM